MQERDFVFWLNGFLELSGATTLNEQQVQVVKEHLALVMTKTTPSVVQPYPTYPVYPSNPLPSDKGWEITCTTTDKLYLQGPKCSGCNKVCSEEGGTCKKCHSNKTAAQLPIVDVPTCLTC